jgi:hypothetical protein
MGWLSRITDRRRQREAVRRIIQESEAKAEALNATISGKLFDAAAESARRQAELEDMAANGTPEERQWATAALNSSLVVTPEEAERISNAPSPTARIERYRASCAAYDAARAADNTLQSAFEAAFPTGNFRKR